MFSAEEATRRGSSRCKLTAIIENLSDRGGFGHQLMLLFSPLGLGRYFGALGDVLGQSRAP